MQPSSKQIAAETDRAAKIVMRKARKSKRYAKSILVQIGILDKNGKLAKGYR